MADVEIVPQQMSRDSITPSYTGSLSASNTYYSHNTGRLFLHFKKSGAGEATITVQTPNSVDGNAIAERTFTVAASTGDKMAGPWPPSVYSDSSGDLRWSSDDITGLTVAPIWL